MPPFENLAIDKRRLHQVGARCYLTDPEKTMCCFSGSECRRL
ncbi:MAG: hypothetical protein R2875_04445 [Desulfobacterales bacterium]